MLCFDAFVYVGIYLSVRILFTHVTHVITLHVAIYMMYYVCMYVCMYACMHACMVGRYVCRYVFMYLLDTNKLCVTDWTFDFPAFCRYVLLWTLAEKIKNKTKQG